MLKELQMLKRDIEQEYSGKNAVGPKKEYIDKSALYEKIAQLEELARNRYLETPSSSLCFSRYMTQLNERTALKHIVADFPSADVAPVRHGRWILEAHDERVNYRWNVTAECSECCDEQKEIWAGFFRDVPSPIARDLALISAESVKLSNYCPNCGAKMDEEDA